MLAAEHGSVASSAGEGSHTGQSKSGSDDSKSGELLFHYLIQHQHGETTW